MTIANKNGSKVFIDRLENFPYFYLVLALSIFFFFTKEILLTPDSGWYLARSINIYKGIGYVDALWQPVTYRAPIFMWFVALYFKLFGPSIVSAYLVVRTFYVGNLILIYFLGKKMFNKFWGVLVFLLVLTASEIYTNSLNLLLDFVMPFFVLLALFFMLLAVETEHWYYFVLSGISLGVAYLTKATAGVFFALPFLLFVLSKNLRSRKFIYFWVLLYSSLAITVLPWFIYLSLAGENPFYEILKGIRIIINPASEQAGINKAIEATPSKLFTNPKRFINLFIDYYNQDFKNYFTLAPILLVAWMKLAIDNVINKDFPRKLLLASGLLFLTLAPIQANVDYGSRHSIVLYLLSFLTLGAAFWPYQKPAIKNWAVLSSSWILSINIAAILMLLGVQIFIGDKSWLKVVKETPPKISSSYPGPGTLVDNGAKHISDILIGRDIKNPNLLVTEAIGNYIYFYDLNQRPLTEFPTVSSKLTDDQEPINDPIAIWNYYGWNSLNVRSRIISSSEQKFIKAIFNKHIDYVIISYRTYPFTFYLYSHPDFALSYGPDEFGNLIFEVANEVHPISSYPNAQYDLQVGRGTYKFLERLKNQRPDDFNLINEKFFKETLGFSRTEVDNILAEKYPLFNETTPLSHLHYIKRVENFYGEDGVTNAIKIQEQKLNWVKNQTSTKELLVTMHLFVGDFNKANELIEPLAHDFPEDKFIQNLHLLTGIAIEQKLTAEKTIEIYEELLEPNHFSKLDESAILKLIN